jgi:tetraacyldisaccharide 4'-kinase
LNPQLDRIQALVVVGVPEGAGSLLDRAQRRGMTLFHGRLEPDRAVVDAIGRRKVLAFAGIADPGKFFATLLVAGIDIADRAAFADHHRYSAAEALDLVARAKANNLMLVTTEKDLVRLTGAPQLEELAAHASTLPVRLVIEEKDQFRNLVLSVLASRSIKAAPGPRQ